MFQTIKNTSPEGGFLLGWCIAMIKMPAVLIVHRINSKNYILIYEEYNLVAYGAVMVSVLLPSVSFELLTKVFSVVFPSIITDTFTQRYCDVTSVPSATSIAAEVLNEVGAVVLLLETA